MTDALEEDHAAELVKWCNRRRLLAVHIPNEGKRGRAEQRKQRRQGLKKGATDFVIALPAGVTVWLELKREDGGTLSPAQRRFAERLRALAHVHITGHGWRDATERLVERFPWLEAEAPGPWSH